MRTWSCSKMVPKASLIILFIVVLISVGLLVPSEAAGAPIKVPKKRHHSKEPPSPGQCSESAPGRGEL
ncbi:hypothetical protein I3760_01G105600 [Carya illinoinensis]|nr:hypothetical protein I3760_01G105600 [Carya illinoinensis]